MKEKEIMSRSSGLPVRGIRSRPSGKILMKRANVLDQTGIFCQAVRERSNRQWYHASFPVT